MSIFNINSQPFEWSFQTTATTFDPTLTKTSGDVRWIISGTSVIGTGITYEFPDTSIKTIKAQLDNYKNITAIEIDNDAIVGNLNLSNFMNVTDYQLQDNPDITTINLPTTTMTVNRFNVYNNTNLTSLNLSNLTNLTTIDYSHGIRIYGNTNMVELLFPTSNKIMDMYSVFNVSSNPSLTTLCLTGLTGLGGYIDLSNNTGLTSLLLPVTTNQINRFHCHNTALTTLDLSNLTNFSSDWTWISNNNNMTNLIMPVSSLNTWGCNINNNSSLSVLCLTGLTNLGGSPNINDARVNFSNNTGLTQLLLPVSPQTIIQFDASYNSALSTISLTGLSGLYGSIDLQYCSNLTNIYFCSGSTGVTTIINLNNCKLQYVDFTVTNWTMSASTIIQLQDNGMNAASVNHILVDIDNKAWLGNTIQINGTNVAPDSISGGYDGLTAKSNLQGKGWIVLTN